MAELKHDGLAIPGRVVLAHELPFDLGRARVIPAIRQIEIGGLAETVEPRVLEVLVALAGAAGAVVTREELIDRCWGGRVVTDDAINRVLSRIRQIGGRANFTLETITKVGYRLAGNASPDLAPAPVAQPAHAPSVGLSRRTLIGGGVAAASLATAAAMWGYSPPHRAPAEAVDLYHRGDLAQRAGTPSQARQAISYLEQAVQLDPKYAAAWGALALALTHTLDGFSEGQMASMAGRIRSAAARALALDPDNADAQLAVVSVTPFFRNWADSEMRLRVLAGRYPDHWLCQGRLAMVLRQVGRLDEAIVHQKRVIAIDPMVPPAYGFAAQALSSAGRIQEADAMLKLALDRWPAHPMLWSTKYAHLLCTGRAESAVAFAMDPENRPSGVAQGDIQPLLVLAKAVEGGDPRDVQSAVQSQLELAHSGAGAIHDAVPNFALLRRADLSFAALDRYLLNRGAFGTPAPIGPITRRSTDVLFTLPMASSRRDPRFAALTRHTGLEHYWRHTRTLPDYLREKALVQA